MLLTDIHDVITTYLLVHISTDILCLFIQHEVCSEIQTISASVPDVGHAFALTPTAMRHMHSKFLWGRVNI